MSNGQHPVICFLYLKFHYKISHKSEASIFDLVTDKLLQECLIFNSIKSEYSHTVFENTVCTASSVSSLRNLGVSAFLPSFSLIYCLNKNVK